MYFVVYLVNYLIETKLCFRIPSITEQNRAWDKVKLEKIMGLAGIGTTIKSNFSNPLVVHDDNTLELLQGLQQEQKSIPSKYFYDQHGSLLFDQICKLEEYYITRTETEIMRQNIHEIAELMASNCLLIEYGSGSSEKTRMMLDQISPIAAYMPVDISREHLFNTAENLYRNYPNLVIFPLWADFTKEFSIPIDTNGFSNKLAYFPGSTIGNFHPQQAVAFMRNVASLVGPGGGFLVGIDLKKDPDILTLAYNDPKGITAAFNLNMLTHLNQKFHADFIENQFEHLAFYNPQAGRIEMHLVSRQDQTVIINGFVFNLHKGERILTEVSYKHTVEGFAELANQAGFEIQKSWLDSKKYFCVQYLVAR
jgi:dimethylhistidine N-methyltransferase